MRLFVSKWAQVKSAINYANRLNFIFKKTDERMMTEPTNLVSVNIFEMSLVFNSKSFIERFKNTLFVHMIEKCRTGLFSTFFLRCKFVFSNTVLKIKILLNNFT